MQVCLKNVSKRFGIKDISLTLEPGDCLGIVGVNGAGKSTLLNCLFGIYGPEKGEILYDGQPYDRSNMELRRKILMIPDHPSYDTSKNLLHLYKQYVQAYGFSASQLKKRFIELVEQFQLSEFIYHPLNSLSRGHAYKASLIPLLTIRPELWLLDEPFATGMDLLGMSVLQDSFRTACQAGQTVVFTTQILDLAERTANKVAVLHGARLVAFGTMNQLQSMAESPGDLQDVVKRLINC